MGGLSKLGDTSRTSSAAASRSAQTNSVPCQFQGRVVTPNDNPISPASIGAHVEGVSSGHSTEPREVTQRVSRASVALLSSGAVGQVGKLTNYLTNHLETGNIPHDLREDLETAISYAQRVDEDIAQAATLLDKLDKGGKLSASEQAEVQALMGAGKHNLSLVQGWLVDKRAQLVNEGQLSHATDTLIQSLQQRFADRHMDVADLISLYDLDEMPQESVSRSDRINANLLQADAAVKVAQRLSPGPEKEAILEVLVEHRDALSQAKMTIDHPGAPQSSDGKLTLAAKEVWGVPFKLVKDKKAKKDDLKALRAHWDNKMQSQSKEPWLPLAHDKVGQTRMLQEFIQHRLMAAGVEKRDLPDLKFMFSQAKNQTFNEQSWDPIDKEVRYYPPAASHLDEETKTKTVRSTITPAKAFAGNFVHDYESSEINGVNCADRLQYQHVPNLAHTQASDEAGQVLFSGLRHGVLDAYDLDAKTLNKLPDATLRSMISDLLVREGALTVPEGETRDVVVADILHLIRTDPKSAGRYAQLMRVEASKNMAQEMAVAALVSDPEKFQRALDGEPVTLDLSSISLLTPDNLRALIKGQKSNEKAMLEIQTAALLGLGKSGPVTLEVRDRNGELRKVHANINIRTFNFGVNGGAIGKMMKIPSSTPVWRNLMGWGFSMAQNNPELTTLVGSSNSRALGGDVGQRLGQMEAQKRQLQDSLQQIAGSDEASAGRVEIGKKIARLDKDLAKLSSVAGQMKDIWRQGSFITGDREPYKMVSRLALVSHLMGETPLFNCKSGKDRTGQLDAEVKCLAAFTEENRVPYVPDQETRGVRQMRSQFTLGSGNLEMQRANVGLPGYKLLWSQVPGLANMVADQKLEGAYRGGSDYIAA